jgi:hypothetical protein
MLIKLPIGEYYCTPLISLNHIQNLKFSLYWGGDSQNFLQKFVRFFITLSLKILRFFRPKIVFEANKIKG